jgi:hypothetical protein
MGMDWWTTDPFFNSRARQVDGDSDQRALSKENAELRAQIEELGGTVPDRHEVRDAEGGSR